LNKKNSINHLSIILDGNKRWAKKNNLRIEEAYNEGIENVLRISKQLIKKNIKYLSVFTLSTENIKRKSVKIIFNSIFSKFSNFLNTIINDNQIRIQVIGERDNLPIKLKELIIEAEEKTQNNTKLTLILAFNYGFKSEIISAFRKGYNEILIKKNFNIDDINLNKFFYLEDTPDPDILIRTGGYKRLSNYLMYNLCYTELFFTNTFWPDFNINELDVFIKEFENIDRNYGL